jgi:hypothetical protein
VTSGAVNALVVARLDQPKSNWSGVYLAEDIQLVNQGFADGSWIDGTIGGFGMAMDALGLITDPLGTLVSWGVAWLLEHVKPLSQALDHLAGDPARISGFAATWKNVSGQLLLLSDEYGRSVGIELDGWAGPASSAYRSHASEHCSALQTLSFAAESMSMITEGVAMLVSLVRTMVRDMIADFVSVLAVRLWEWIAEEAGTLGIGTPWVIAQVGSLVGRWADKITHLLRALVTSLHRLMPMLRRIEEIIGQLKALLRRLHGGHAADAAAPLSRDSHLFHGDADPLGKWGSAFDTHPDEVDGFIQRAEDLGVEINWREDGGLAYGPGASPGTPGVLSMDRDASYGAWLHEMSHLSDDAEAGWAGMRGWFTDPAERIANEQRAYQQEIDYALSIGDTESAAKLQELFQAEVRKILGQE